MTGNAPIAIDLFSGAGGLSEGLESVGIHVATAIEWHPQPCLTHAFNHPHTQVLVGDIRSLQMDLLRKYVHRATGTSKVDLVVGGPPCQGFSSAGRKSQADPRNTLFREFIRVVENFKPRMFLLENVPGFRKMYQGQMFAEATKEFSRLGYQITSNIVDAAPFGVPQRRKRFIMIGWLPNEALPFEWPDEVLGKNGQLTIFSQPMVTVENALEDIAFLEPGWEATQHQVEPIYNFQQDRRRGAKLLFNHLATQHREKAVSMFEYIPEGGTINAVPKNLRNGKKTMARLNRHEISNAVLALPDDLIHYRHNRIPTVREMARLQTFDDDYVFFGKRTSGFIERRVDLPQYTQVGNAVPPLLAKALGRNLIRSLEGIERDIRDIATRRARHGWVLGSSGFAGYTLDLQATKEINIINVAGETLPLPISNDDMPVLQQDVLRRWNNTHNPRRGQWAPGINPRPVPSHMVVEEEKEEEIASD